MKEKVVIALGGNAILQPGQKGLYEEQKANVQRTCEHVADLIEDGYMLAITHGNGPQVGNIIVQNKLAESQVPSMPLFVLGAKSQGMIGFLIQNSLDQALKKRGVDKRVATVITQVEVDRNDSAFHDPSKPVGMFFSEEEAKKFMAETGEVWKEDSNRGWRKVVASPKPEDIVEKDIVSDLLDKDIVVISGGGGGIPVVKNREGIYEGVEAVIDKDLVASRLADVIDADAMMILTDVPNAMLNYKQENEKKLEKVTVEEMREHLDNGHFSKGSMEPKVKACVEFVEKTGKRAIITSLDTVRSALLGENGTIIFKT